MLQNNFRNIKQNTVINANKQPLITQLNNKTNKNSMTTKQITVNNKNIDLNIDIKQGKRELVKGSGKYNQYFVLDNINSFAELVDIGFPDKVVNDLEKDYLNKFFTYLSRDPSTVKKDDVTEKLKQVKTGEATIETFTANLVAWATETRSTDGSDTIKVLEKQKKAILIDCGKLKESFRTETDNVKRLEIKTQLETKIKETTDITRRIQEEQVKESEATMLALMADM